MLNLTDKASLKNEFNLLNLPKVFPKSEIKYTGVSPIIEKLWYIALDDAEKNYCMDTPYGRVYAAGGYGKHANWKGLTFNRDTCYSGLLALNALYPKEMLTSLKIIRTYRDKLAFNCTPETELEGIDGVQVNDISFDEFKNIYHKGTAINKTDDVVWIWCAYDLIKKNNLNEYEWLYNTAKQDFKKFYDPFFDANDGLYFGQPTFIDVGSNGYPESFGMKTKAAYNNGVWVKASSTNALYYKALTVMSETAEKLGLLNESQNWSKRAENLKSAIRNNLRFDDGTFCYFMHKNGLLEKRREILGTVFNVLFDIVSGADAAAALKGYPVTAFGAPLIFPFYENDRVLHNNSAWPFADTFLLLALEKAYSADYTDLNLQIMINDSVFGHIGEFRNMLTNQMNGATAQLWSIAGFINTCIRANLTDLNSDKIKIY